ncbi:MAG: uracil-DNA glycosylase family protein [Pseudomonadota bacterium]
MTSITTMPEPLASVARSIRRCTICAPNFDHRPRPILQVGRKAKVAIFSQAPGNVAHQKGKPFFDPSGVRLRQWLGVTEAVFYDPDVFAIVPMAFCFPGYDKYGGDNPPPKVCAQTWRERLLEAMPKLELALLIGSYSQSWHLGTARKRTMTETVRAWRSYGPLYVPTPHPSWRNNHWLKKNPWFEEEVLPEIRARIANVTKGLKSDRLG